MRKKIKTIKLAKIRRYLRELARRKYEWNYSTIMENDIDKISKKIYNICKKNQKV